MTKLYQVFKEDLLKDEEILWSGQPEPKIRFTKMDIFLVPFSLMWGGFAIFWEMGVLFIKSDSGKGAPVVFSLFGIPFVLMGLYIIFGRFIYKAWKKKNTYYALTNKRALVLTKLRNRNIKALYVNTIPCVNKSVRSNGFGSVVFGNSSFMASMYANTGLDFMGSFYGDQALTFYDIKDVDRVCATVNELRNN